MPLRAIVIGAGWAGEGHSRALQHCGVEVVALCARNQGVVEEVAGRLGIQNASSNWRHTLDNFRPDIVSIATPAILRTEIVEAATELGCHILCEKPLATTASEAAHILRRVEKAGVKHAYAATHLYDPSVAWLRELLDDGLIGQVHDITIVYRQNLPKVVPWFWVGSLEHGGGILNNVMPHFLGILTYILRGKLNRAVGESRQMMTQAPVIPEIHDTRDWRATLGKIRLEDVADFEWRAWDADMASTALLSFGSARGDINVTVLLGPGVRMPNETNGIWFHGDKGTLHAAGDFSYTVALAQKRSDIPQSLPVPQRLLDCFPQVGDAIQNKWCSLAADFVSDLKGQPYAKYLTFRDGWSFQCGIDAIRSGQGWIEIPA